MAHLLLLAAAILALASASACRHEQGPSHDATRRVVDAASLREAMQLRAIETDPLFWRVESAGGATLFLLGSIHFGPPSGWHQPRDIDAVFERASAVVVEIDLREITPVEMQDTLSRHALLPEGETLADHVLPETLELLGAYLQVHDASLEEVSSLRPWMIAQLISADSVARLGFTSATGIDRAYLARVDEQEVIALESTASQIRVLAGMAPRLQEIALVDALEEAEVADVDVMELALAWQLGREEELAALVNDPFERNPSLEPFRYQLVDARNRAMSARLDDLARDPARAGQEVFVIVGAAHFVDDHSIIELLRERGLVVRELGPSRESDIERTAEEDG